MLFFLITMPSSAGETPTVPMIQTFSAISRLISWPTETRSSAGSPLAFSKSSSCFNRSPSGFLPSFPPDWNQSPEAGPMPLSWLNAIACGGYVNGLSDPSFDQTRICSSLAFKRRVIRLRSTCSTLALTPIFLSHCWATISLMPVQLTNAAPTVVTVRMSGPPPSVRMRMPSGPFWRPSLSRISLACFGSSVECSLREPGPALNSVDSAGAGPPGSPWPSQNTSLSWSRSMPSESAMRNSLFVSHLAISGSPS